MARRVAPEAPIVAPFDLLAQYDLLEEIGGGERARVYRARDRVLDHAVAVKLLRDRYGRDASLAAHLYLTARAAASLGHPNIVTVFDQGEHDGSAFITMELVEGRNLADLLAQEGPLPTRWALPIVARILDALSAAHAYGIAHGDLHPRNVLLRANGADGAAVVLTDFGMSLAWERTDHFAPYRAPEERSGDPASIAGDLYAVGVILYELLTGEKPPYDGLKRRPATIARPLFATIGRALAATPADRYPTAAALREALTVTGGAALPAVWVTAPEGPLEAAVRVTEIPPTRTRAPQRRGPYRTAAVLVAGTLALGSLAGAAVLATNPRTTPQPTAAVTATEETVEQPVAPPVEETPQAVEPAPRIEPTANVAASAPTVVVTPTVAAVQPTAAPTLSPQGAALAPNLTAPPALAQAPTPTAGPRPTPTASTPRVVANGGVGGAVGVSLENFSPYLLQGAYQSSDGRRRENAQVALYGAGSGYNVGILTFEATDLPTSQITLVLTGIDDELASHSTIQVLLNGRTLFTGASGFANRPAAASSNPDGSIAWDQMRLIVPQGTLQSGTNTLVIRNVSTGAELAPPYILINNLEFASEAP
jgi:serine/threonine-protein kinase